MRHDQCEALADLVRRTVCQRSGSTWQVPFTDLPTMEVIGRESLQAGGVDPVGQMPHVLFNFTEEFALYAAAV